MVWLCYHIQECKSNQQRRSGQRWVLKGGGLYRVHREERSNKRGVTGKGGFLSVAIPSGARSASRLSQSEASWGRRSS